MSCSYTVEIGAYVLGALAPGERAMIEEHVNGCAACRQEIVKLAPLPGLMLRVSAEEAAGFVDPGLVDQTSLAALKRRVRRHRGGRRWLAAGAAALVLGGGGVWFGALHDSASSIALHGSDPGSGVHMSATMQPEGWGTRINLSISGVPTGVRCWLEVRSRNGVTETAGSWQATRYPTSHLPASTSIPLPSVAALDVVTGSGKQLIDLQRT